jgi:ubiquinone/menaquinone biosynthesis C-methylase UbiE/ribosomal protein L32
VEKRNQNLQRKPFEVPLSQRTRQLKIINYEGSSYKTDFWEGQGREFEDITERTAIHRLLPPTGGTIIEIGAGFGRLADLYSNYDQVILLDYSLSLLSEAKNTFGENPKYKFVAANVYNLPFADNVADTMIMIRVAHHLESVASALAEIHRVLQGDQPFILEFANKRNVKSIVRYIFKRQSWSPFDQAPYEFVPLNFDFHPNWMAQTIQQAGFRTEESLAISNFRLPAIKNRISPQTLARIDNAIARPGAALKLSPSVLTKNISIKKKQAATGLFKCPKCGGQDLEHTEDAVICPDCKSRWPITDGIIDFRYPRPEAN